uniref:Uncharacterized protein n=1 Tax=Onchocerca volvulus TaxID=6282 RepID=A0A8R1TRS8_ONCVO
MSSHYAFNPNDKKYYSCGCHVKKFTVIFGILEMFLVCFLITTALPNLNSRLCNELINKTYPMSSYANDTLSESKQQQFEKFVLQFIYFFGCNLER